MSPTELFGFLREFRVNQGLSQAEVARRCQVSPATVSLWESQDRLPPIDEILKWGEALGLRIELEPRPVRVDEAAQQRWSTIALALEVLESATPAELAAVNAMMRGLQRRSD